MTRLSPSRSHVMHYAPRVTVPGVRSRVTGHGSRITGFHGFTLIELLVAIFLLAVLSVMAYRGIDSMARAEEHVVGLSERWQAITLFFERFGTDVSQASLRAVHDGTGQLLPQWWGRPLPEATNLDAQLEFTRKSPPGQDDVRLAYRLRKNTLELLVWPVLDRSPLSQPQVYPLLENVNAVHLRYLDSQGRWQDAWPAPGVNEPMPRAVWIEVAFFDQPTVNRLFALP